MSKRVLILTCDSGGGHRSVADAVHAALVRQFPGRYQVDMADIMADGFCWPLSQAGRIYGPVVNRFPRWWALFWNVTNGARRAPLTLRMIAPFGKAQLKRLVAQSNPSVIVSTHPWASYFSSWVLGGLGMRVPLVTVITDLVSIHYWWLCPDVDLCLVSTDAVRDEAVQAGFLSTKVRVVGIPVHLDFANPSSSRSSMRRDLGLDEDRFTILLTSGGDGIGQILPVARAVGIGVPEAQLIIVTGRNVTLRRRLREFTWQVPVRILGFVTDMPSVMGAADVIASKAGPSTISEALVCGLPILITGFIRGQEEGNIQWVLARGAGLYTPTPDKVVSTVRRLMGKDRDTLQHMALRAREAARPTAALDAALLMDELLSAKQR